MLDPSDAQNILVTFQYLCQSKRLRMRKQLEPIFYHISSRAGTQM